MTRTQIEETRVDTIQDHEPKALFEKVVSGAPIDRTVQLKDTDTGETVGIIPGDGGTIVTQGIFERSIRVPGKALQMQDQRPNDKTHLTTMPTTSGTLSRIEPRARYVNLCPAPSPGLERILTRDRDVRRQALEWQQKHGDPLERLQEILGEFIGESPEDIESWNELVEELS
jgi:hypothetical protein